MDVVIEGWRFLPHSYALWSQYLCLDLLARPGISLYHLDAPMADARWTPTRGVLAPEQEAALAAIPAPPPGLRPDVLVRLKFPYDFSPSPAAKTIVVATAEYGMVPATSCWAAAISGRPRRNRGSPS